MFRYQLHIITFTFLYIDYVCVAASMNETNEDIEVEYHITNDNDLIEIVDIDIIEIVNETNEEINVVKNMTETIPQRETINLLEAIMGFMAFMFIMFCFFVLSVIFSICCAGCD